MRNSTTTTFLGKVICNHYRLLLLKGAKFCLAFIMLLASISVSKAQVVTDDFSYTASTLLTANGWTAISGGGTNAITVTTPGLVYSSYAGSGVGNAASLTTNGEDDSKTFAAITSGTVYFSAMINCSAAQAGGDYFLSLNGSVFAGRLYIKSSGAGYVVGIGKTSEAAPTYDVTVRSFNTTYFVVVKYSYVTGATNDIGNLWINPAVGGTETVATVPSVTSTAADATSLSSITLRQGGASTAPTVKVDGIRVGVTWASVTPSSSTVSGAPTGVSAVPGNGQATVSFTAPVSDGGSTITSYTATSNPGGFTGTINQAGSGFIVVIGLTNGTPYTFTVVATNGAGSSAPSTASGSVTPFTVPNSPTIGTAVAGNGQATVSYTAPVSDGGSPITSYTATSSPGGFTGTINQAGSGSVVVTGLTNGTPYTFTIVATNVAGSSAVSSVSNAVTPTSGPTVPDAPGIGTAVAGNGQVTVSYTSPAFDGGSAITSYTATSSPGGITGTINQSGSGSIVVTGLTNGISYTFTVTATNGIGTGAPTVPSNTVTPSTIPDAPSIGTALAGNGQATISFTAPAFNGGASITSYTATSSPGGFTGTVNQSGSGSIVVTGLTNGTAYTFTVTASNIAGTSAASNPTNSVTPANVSNPPVIGTATVGNGQATIAFTAPSFDGGSSITSYTAISSPGNLTGTVNQSGSGSIVVTGLTNGTAYTFTVTATNSIGTSVASGVSNSVTPVTVPGAPTGVTAVGGDQQATVSFSAPASNGASAITSYTATSSPGGFTGTVNQAGSGSIIVSGLTNGTVYTFTVRAANAVGTSAASTSSNSVTPAFVLPVIAKWTFEGVSVSSTAGTTVNVTSGGVVADAGLQTAGSSFTGVHTSASTVWSTPAGNGSAKSLSANNWAVGNYIQFVVNTTNYSGLSISFDQTGSGTGPRDFKLQFSPNGSTFTDFTTYTVPNNAGTAYGWNAATPIPQSALTFDLSTVTALNNISTAYFRLVDNSTTAIGGAAVATAGTGRVDNFSVSGILSLTTIWQGSNGANWNVAGNWSAGVPAGNTNVVINSGYPLLNVDFAVGAGKSLTISGTSALIIDAGKTLTIAGTANFGGKSVIIKSTQSGTGAIGQISGSGANLTGATNVTVERYVPDNAFRSWRLLSVPVTTTQTIRQAWQEGDANPNPKDNNVANYGTQITGVFTTQAAAAAAGFDSTSIQAGMLRWNGSAWSNINSTNQPINNFNSYFLYVRGERNQTVTGSVNSSSATTLRTTGTVFTGDQTFNVGANSFSLLPNLYPSAINFTGLSKTGGVNDLFYIWDSKKLNGNSLGVYQTFSSTNSFNCLIAGGSYVVGQPNTTIESGQSFFVSSGLSGTVTLTESAKISGTNGSLGFRPSAVKRKIDTRLYNATGEMLDANTIVFNADYSNAVGPEDAPKLGNPAANFAIETNDKLLAIAGMEPAKDGDVFQYRLWNLANGTYTIEIAQSNLNLTSGLVATVEDSYLKTSLSLTNDKIKVSFNVDANSGSSDPKRFRVVIRKLKPLVSLAKQSFNIVPNPVESRKMNIVMNDQPAGKYTVILTGLFGQIVSKTIINHSSGNCSDVVAVPLGLSDGMYNVEVMGSNNYKASQQIFISLK